MPSYLASSSNLNDIRKAVNSGHLNSTVDWRFTLPVQL